MDADDKMGSGPWSDKDDAYMLRREIHNQQRRIDEAKQALMDWWLSGMDDAALWNRAARLLGVTSAEFAAHPCDRELAGRRTTTAMCERKTNDIMTRGYRKVGYILMTDNPTDQICLSALGAVSWLDRDEYQWLMHNRDHVEFIWPKPLLSSARTCQEAAPPTNPPAKDAP